MFTFAPETSARFIGLFPALAGTLLGGALGEWIGVPATVVVGAVGGLFAFVWLLLSPVRGLREMPSEEF